jgi:hypothetical protein
MEVVRCLTRGATSRELARPRQGRTMSLPLGVISMRNQVKFYFNLAIMGFIVGRAYGAFRQRLARDVQARRRVWS